MSDKTWYEHLDEEDLDGKHVQVTLADGTVLSGRLTVRDDYPDVALLSTALVLPYEDGTKADWPIGVMCQTEDPRWLPFEGVTDISLVWDERDCQQIDIKDMKAGDIAVVAGHLVQAASVSPGQGLSTSGGRAIPFSIVSCALRCRSGLPTEPGFYRDGDGTLYYLSTLAEFWVMETPEKWNCMRGLPDKPLAPVHFVDGRA